ncbi:hypothetical protein HYQ45_015862 [Verticillium longisporum]|uniref:Uncharacterized protein n=1 Tax=Verticillium longisporum TaxID=100787 RepID=A0A8I2Z9E7_VERLO|nr:hypothetical protein HYQ45_015862 [Verticillium longisporum]
MHTSPNAWYGLSVLQRQRTSSNNTFGIARPRYRRYLRDHTSFLRTVVRVLMGLMDLWMGSPRTWDYSLLYNIQLNRVLRQSLLCLAKVLSANGRTKKVSFKGHRTLCCTSLSFKRRSEELCWVLDHCTINMESHSSQCFICSIQFSTPEKLREHVWHYQTEITALFVRISYGTLLDTCGATNFVHSALPLIPKRTSISATSA